MEYECKNHGSRLYKCMDWVDNHDACKNCELREIDMNYTKAQYKEALDIACQLLNKGNIYGIDDDVLFANLMQKYECVSAHTYQKFILANLDRFSDDEEVRANAVKRLGW